MSSDRITAEAVPQLSTTLTWRDTLTRWGFRWGIGRMNARFEPGLYRIGEPTPASPVLVTCNYRMTVDIVRRDLAGTDAWLLVLETYGINVWCAAGKKTFGTDELVRRIFDTHLADHVEHETLVLPQLGAVGVSANAVRAATGYRVVWGPVRSSDLRAFLAAGLKATPEMRAVTFTTRERLVLAPMEFVPSLKYGIWAVPVLVVLGVLGASIALAHLRMAGRTPRALPGAAHLRAGGLRRLDRPAGLAALAPGPRVHREERGRRCRARPAGPARAPRHARHDEPVAVERSRARSRRGRFVHRRELHGLDAVHFSQWRGVRASPCDPGTGRGARYRTRVLDRRLGDANRRLTCKDCATSKKP